MPHGVTQIHIHTEQNHKVSDLCSAKVSEENPGALGMGARGRIG